MLKSFLRPMSLVVFAYFAFANTVLAQVIINEVDADTPSFDMAEFVELYDGGVGGTDLSGLVLVAYNGSSDTSYRAFDLDGLTTDGSGYFVICGNAANVANCDLDVTPDQDLIQNGADAVALYTANAADFPNGTAVTTANLLDALVYDTNDSDDAGLLVLLTGGGQVNEDGGVDKDTESNQRCPNGSGGARNTTNYTQSTPTPGTENCAAPPPDFVINEVDADDVGTDDAEFVEIYDGGIGNSDLSGLVLVLFNGSDDLSYNSFDLDGQSTDADGYFLACGNPATTPNCDLDLPGTTNVIQNGADAVALIVGDAADYPNDTPIPGSGILDALVYDTNDGDDAVLLAGLLNPGQPQINEDGNGNKDTESNQRCSNGSGGQRNTNTYAQHAPTPGVENECPAPPSPMLINEIDADQIGSDAAEFIELYDGGLGNTDLTGLVLVLYNGNGDVSYRAWDLDGRTTDMDGYFVLCGNAATTANCDFDVGVATNLIQNGADAAALYAGDGADFPNGTAVTTAGLIDAIVYDTNDSDDAGLLVLLDAGGQVNEGTNNSAAESNQRCPNGSGAQRDTSTYEQWIPTPGIENRCRAPLVGPIQIWEIQGDGLSSPFEGFEVITEDNIVTALAPNGFFMQTPPSNSDNDVDTSDGIFVFTGGAPAVAVGDMVDVQGDVTEFFGFTEYEFGATVTVTNMGLPIPPAVQFNAAVPSPDPAAPSCAIEFECYEGMLVEVANGTTTGPNQGFFTDPVAEVHITAGAARTFREPGIAFPGLPGLPVWDGNPEVFELDPDKLGLPNQIIPAGSSFSATGVIGFEFGGYELWPTSLSVIENPIPGPVRDAGDSR